MADIRAAEFNGEEDEDEALRIAIARSLGQDLGTRRATRSDGGLDSGSVIDLTRDQDEPGDDVGKAANMADETSSQRPTASDHHPAASASSFAALGLDRKRMEEERLARLRKRKASGTVEDSGSRPAQRPKTMTRASPPPRLGTAPGEENNLPAEPRVTVSPKEPSLQLPFPRGVVKKTWAFGQPRLGDDIKIEEVLQKDQLELAVLSSYQWDEEWLLSKIDLARTRLVLVAYAADEAQKEEMRSNVPRDRIRFCFPPMQPMGSMHSKLQLLKYGKYMRIVVPTGNLMSFDWGETGTMENMVFIIDVPKLETAEQRETQQVTPFAEELFCFLRAQGLDEKLVDSLHNYDFSETGRYRFVHTIPGSHIEEDAWKRTGYCGLGRAVSALGRASTDVVEVDFVCASLGAVNISLLAALYYACQGDCGLKEYNLRMSGRNAKNASRDGPDDAHAVVRDHLRVFFPSHRTVVQSKGGKDGAGTICFQAKWWELSSFPREVLRDCRSVRQGLVMHAKVMYVRPGDTSLSCSTSGLAYVGSANLSESAWGRLVRDRTTGRPKLGCRNWESGVLIQAASEGPSTTGGSMFGGCVPIPMVWPSQALATGSGDRPWFYRDG